MSVLFLSLVFSEVFSAAHAASVLLIWDDSASNANTLSLKTALEAEGHVVTLSTLGQSNYDGASPAPTGFGAVIHLNGDTYATVMPTAGRAALLAYVQGGGGYIGNEWGAYQQYQLGTNELRDLTLFDRSTGGNGGIAVTVTDASHPVMAGVPSSFFISSGYNVGPAHTFASDPVSVLATDGSGSAAVAVREYMAGRVVGFHHAGNWSGATTLTDANVQLLYANAVEWASGGGSTDVDGDGYDSLAAGGDDCDDGDASVYPGAAEAVGDMVDQDCDGINEMSVLLIWDDSATNADTLALEAAIEAQGHVVTLSTVSQTNYDGASPSPYAFNAVIHLNGDTYDYVMPAAGQAALLAYVQGGGGYIGNEWGAYQQYTYGTNDLRELTLLDRTSGREGSVTVTVTDAAHPVMAGLASSFTFNAGCNIGSEHVFASDPVSVLAVDGDGSAAVAVREYMAGRVVSFHHAGNYASFTALSDANVQLLYVNAINWAGGIAVEPCADADADGFTDLACGGTDCDDANVWAYPGAVERAYDGIDQDCDGADVCDVDGDGQDSNLCSGGTDCDDANPAAYLGAAEIWYDGVDEDCLGGSDDDQDGDGDNALPYGGGDCDDTDSRVNSGAAEIWYDGVDENCDGLDDFDADYDGYGSASYGGNDCDDNNADTYPGAPDDYYDGVINDCDGADEYDQDGDGALDPSGGGNDCDDNNSSIFPRAEEIPADGLDSDCNGGDLCFVDADGDGQRTPDGATTPSADVVCDGAGEAVEADPATDCDDGAATTYDGAPELCDGVDNSCEGDVDEGCDTGTDDTGADDTGATDDTAADSGGDSGAEDSGGKDDVACGCAAGGSGGAGGAALAIGLLGLTLRRRRG